MNSRESDDNTLNPNILPVQTVQIITIALINGILVFLGIVVINGMAPDPPAQPLLAFVGVALAVSSVIGRVVVPGLIPLRPAELNTPQFQNLEVTESNRKALSLYGMFQTQVIIGMALLEGAALINAVAYMLEGHLWSLGVIGGLVFLMLLSFPTRSRAAFWVENKMQYEDRE